MNFLFFKLKYLLTIYFLLSFFINFQTIEKTINTQENINQINEKDNIIIEKKSIKKTRKVDISILRENLVNQFITLLKLVEKALTKILNDIKKENYITQSKEIMNIFHWVNECIEKFNADPTLYSRSDIESYLNQAQKYELFLNSI